MDLVGSALTPLGATTPELVILGVVAFFVGLLAGMMGTALGVISLPVMLAMGFNPVIAAGTNLGVNLLWGLTAAWPHYRDHRVVTRVLIVIGVPAVVGSFLGALFADAAPTGVLLGIISAILGYSALETLRQVWKATRRPLRPIRHRPPPVRVDPTGVSNLKPRRVAIDTAIGLFIGALGGAVGMVLGSLRLPILLNVLHMSPGFAAGTNNAIGIMAAIAGFGGHALNGNIDLAVLGVMGLVGMIGSYIGASQTGRIRPVVLRAAIGVMLIAVIPLVVLRAVASVPN